MLSRRCKVSDITITVTIHPDGSISGQGVPDVDGIISQLLANEQFINAVASQVAELQSRSPRPHIRQTSSADAQPMEYALPRYNFVQTFSKAELYCLVWGLRTQVGQILARADVDPAEAIVMTDRELRKLRLMGEKSMVELKEKRRHIGKRALQFDLPRMRKAVRTMLASGLFDDDENLRIDDDSYTLVCSASRFRLLVELMEKHKIKAHEVLVEDEIHARSETAEKVS